MVPTLRHGDLVVVRRADHAQLGDVVLARFRTLPDRFVVKRVVRRAADGWWLRSDNPFAGGDSDSLGAADILGLVLWRLRPGRPRRVR